MLVSEIGPNWLSNSEVKETAISTKSEGPLPEILVGSPAVLKCYNSRLEQTLIPLALVGRLTGYQQQNSGMCEMLHKFLNIACILGDI